MKAKYFTDKDSQGKPVGLTFYCPACQRRHQVSVKPGGWTFNGDLERPTLSPSVLVRSGHYGSPDGKPGNCACDYQERFPDKEPWPWPCIRCHSFVTDGMIHYCGDSSHVLAGQSVPLPDMETTHE